MGENVEIKAGLCYNKRQTAQPKCEAEEESRQLELLKDQYGNLIVNE